MCITSAKAKLSKTRIMSMALDNGRHLMSYSNKAQNLSGNKNSMILAIPGKLKREWFMDTTNYNKFLENIEDQAHLNYDESHGVYSRGISFKSKGFDRFNIGMYDILIAEDIREIVERLGAMGPVISEELTNFFEIHYKGWSFVFCIFDGSEEMDSQPVTFEYEPFHYNWLYFPTMDSHGGGAPNLVGEVKMDHTLIYEYPGLADRVVNNVKFSQEVPEVLKRRNYVATKWEKSLINADMYINFETLQKYANDKTFCYDGFKRLTSHPESKIFA